MTPTPCDVLVIGGGLAGLAAALEARRAGADVLLLCKRRPGRSGNTIVAAGNLSGVFPEEGAGDTVEAFVHDTLAGGRGIGDPELARALAAGSTEAPTFLEWGGVRLRREGLRLLCKAVPGHGAARTVSVVHDSRPVSTAGLALTLPLLSRARAEGIRFLEDAAAVRLERAGGRVVGATAVAADGTLFSLKAGAVVLASGGGGRLYARSNNTGEMTGDGLALAYEAGAEVRDLEFVQFHPTMGISPVRAILPTTLFADGAVLRNRSGERFLLRAAPGGEAAATRDAMSRAIFEEVAAGRGVGPGVHLDLTGVPARTAEARYRALWEALARKGHDPSREPVVVGVTTHFLMGGMTVDPTGASTIPGLFGAGEVAGGVHGANRLGGNALMEAVVFGRIAGRSAAAAARPPAAPEEEPVVASENPAAPEVLGELAKGVRRVLWEEAGVLRTGERLDRGFARWEELRERFGALPPGAGGARWFETRSLLTVARLVLEAARRRTESRGAHQRVDHPAQDDVRWRGSLRIRRGSAGDPEFRYVPAP